MFSYTAYELGINSEINLPGLTAATNTLQDVFVHLENLDTKASAETRSALYFLGQTTGVATFLVRNGNEIIIDPLPGADDALVSAILLGPILSVLLRQRGLAVIHASGIVRDGAGVAFIGDSGCGKSTLAAAFYKRGYTVVTDDVMAVRLEAGGPQVLPGYPSIRLLPDTAAFLGCKDSATHNVHSQTDKMAHCVSSKFPQKSMPLRRMYVLARGEQDEIQPLQPQEIFGELVRNSRALTLMRDPESLRNSFAPMHQAGRGCAGLPFATTPRPDCASEVVELIEKDLAQ